MTTNDVAKLGFKLLAAYFVIQIFHQSENICKYLLYSKEMQGFLKANYIAAILPSILFSLAGIILWFIAPNLANSIFKPKSEEEKGQVTVENVHMIAFSVAGLFLFATSFSEIVEYIVIDIKAASSTGESPLTHLIIVAVLKIILGIWLILGSKGIVNGIHSLRQSGHRFKGEATKPKILECPHCGADYTPNDYRPEASEWLCPHCAKPLPMG